MKTIPRFLYGDSTPSTLTTNYIAFIRDFFDFAVDVLLHESRSCVAAEHVENLSKATNAEISTAEALVAGVGLALERSPVGNSESIAARCAARIQQGVQDLVRSEAAAARAVVAMETTRAAQVALHAQSACARAFEALIVRQELPQSVVSTTVRIDGANHYLVRLHGQTPYGLRWTTDIAVPAQQALAHPLRIGSVIEHLEVDAPEMIGWLRKEVHVRKQRLDRLYLTDFAVEATGASMKLRASLEPLSPGYDVSFSDAPARVELQRVAAQATEPDSPHEASETDAAVLWSLRDTLAEMVEELAENRQSLVVASLDETPIHQLERPRALVERLIDALSPTVHEIQTRSPIFDELSLKRVLSETQREEVFVSKAELLKKLEPLPAVMRNVFQPLGLSETTGTSPPPVPARSTAAAPAAVPSGTLSNEVAVPKAGAIPSFSAGALRGQAWHSETRDGASSTGKWPALHPSAIASVPA